LKLIPTQEINFLYPSRLYDATSFCQENNNVINPKHKTHSCVISPRGSLCTNLYYTVTRVLLAYGVLAVESVWMAAWKCRICDVVGWIRI